MESFLPVPPIRVAKGLDLNRLEWVAWSVSMAISRNENLLEEKFFIVVRSILPVRLLLGKSRLMLEFLAVDVRLWFGMLTS